MKAAVVRDFREGPGYDDFAAPRAEGRDVVVDVLASALSPRTRSGASGEHYRSSGILPLIPGIDGVGIVDGRRVYFVASEDTRGAMAEQTLANPKLMVPLPEGVSATAVAAGMLPAISSWVALTKRVALQKNQSVLVLGATGTSGQLAVQIAKHLGAGSVIAAGRDEAALQRVKSLGADAVVKLSGTDADAKVIAEAASEVDVVVDYLWGSVTTAAMPALCSRREDESRAISWILVGSMAGAEINLSSVLLRKRNLHILGSGQGASSVAELFSVTGDIISAFSSGKLEVQVREVPLVDVEKAWPLRTDSGERVVFVP